MRENKTFYIDKSRFIKEWWEQADQVTLITRPRRFGKTLNMSMVEKFFSVNYAGRSDLFQGLEVWEDERYRRLQGTYPVLFISLANVKETNYEMARKKFCQILTNLYSRYYFMMDEGTLDEKEEKFFRSVFFDMDEYDTPMQEAYVNGYWEEMVSFTRNLFNSTFKINPCLEQAIMTGITRVSKESIFSDLNNLEVVTTTSEKIEEKKYEAMLIEKGVPGKGIRKYGFAFCGQRVLIGRKGKVITLKEKTIVEAVV